MAGDNGSEKGASSDAAGAAQPRQEVVIRTVREVSGNSWPQLTRTNYGEWVVTMRFKLRARRLWTAVETVTDNEDDDVAAMEVLLSSTPAEYHEAIGQKKSAKEAWDMLASMRIGSDRAKKARAQQLRREFDDLKFCSGKAVEDFALRLQSLVSQLAVFGKTMDEEDVVAKFLRVVPAKYSQIALSIEMMLDMSTLTIEDVTGRLRAVDDRSNTPAEKEKDNGKLLLTEEEWTAG